MSSSASAKPAGFLTFTLHAHLPYVVNHGTWPHGMEWLHEAAAETYLPLLRILSRLEKDGIGLHCNLNLSPVLLEQLAHPVFLAEFPNYLTRKIVSAREDEAFFVQSGELHYAETARFWQRFFKDALDDFNALGRSIIDGFRHFHQAGLIEIITCGATHGYLPLLGTDESIRAQLRTAVQTHIRHIGEPPRGIWIPECGYRPAGLWSYPVPNADGSPTPPPFERIGVEQALSESALDFFFVDTHLVEGSEPISSPYRLPHSQVEPSPQQPAASTLRSLYQAYFVGELSSTSPVSNHPQPAQPRPTTVLPRDPRTGAQVWSADSGYPGDGNYLDFHKKRWPGGHRYWRVTGPRVDMGDKQPYFPLDAAARVQDHAAHFVDLVRQALADASRKNATQASAGSPVTPILCAPFDAELFGHWWFEGILWLEAVARLLHERPGGLELISCTHYLQQHPPTTTISMQEGSWGAEGNNHVWLNADTSWTYTHLYPAELYTREVCTAGLWRKTELGTRIVQQLCRELLLLESSDWQFLITTGAARDYAELRFLTHNEQFLELKSIWQSFEQHGTLNEHQTTRLDAIQTRDSLFPDLNPAFWSLNASDP